MAAPHFSTRRGRGAHTLLLPVTMKTRWLIAAGEFVHEAVALTPNDGTGGRGPVAARDIAEGVFEAVEKQRISFVERPD
jgi:hypothetical protein